MTSDFISLRKNELKIEQIGVASFSAGKSNENFVEWNWSGETLTVKNDRLGFRPLFYFYSHREIAVSPSLVKLVELDAPLDLDDAAMAVFLRLGYFVGDDTPFRAVRAFPPNSILIWQNGNLTLENKGLPKVAALDLSFDDAVHGFASVFRRSVSKLLPENDNFAVPLSGGRDSRLIFLELLRQNAAPRECVTLEHLPPRSNDDARIAAELCQSAGVKHKILAQPAQRIPAELRKNLLTHFCADEHAWYLPLADYLKENGFAKFYDGIAVDVFLVNLLARNAAVVESFQNKDFDDAARRLMPPEAYLPKFLKPAPYRRFSRELALERFKIELRKHADAPNPLGAFLFWNRTRREIALATFSLLGESSEAATPFLETETIDFLMSLRFKPNENRDIREAAIKRFYPKFGAIPYETIDSPANVDRRVLQNFSWELVRFASARKSAFVKQSFVAARAGRSLIQLKYAEAFSWFAPSVIHLLHLERFVEERRTHLKSVAN